MDFDEYRKDFMETVRSTAAADKNSTPSTFIKVFLDMLQEIEVVLDYEIAYCDRKTRKGKIFKVDAYSFDDFDKSVTLIISDFYNGDDEAVLTRTDANQFFDRLCTFIDESISHNLKKELDISTEAYDLVDRIEKAKDEIRKIKLYIITNKTSSKAIGIFPNSDFKGIPTEYHIWDLNRLYRVCGSLEGREQIEIDFTRYTKLGIPCLEASSASTKDFRCFLCVIPGSVLADIYDEYGSRLLEGNVRSFLSTKVAVNKAIRATIIGENRDMFFALNNGIAATASEVEFDKSNGKYLIYAKDLQIVNGGQTTASLSTARFKDKASLDGIFVQMKLTEVEPGFAQEKEIIPKISRASNSQNKVSEADFFSNHKFHIRLEQISRRIYAPAVNGAQFETHWFYERARGQYTQAQLKMTKAQKNQFQNQNPKAQVLTKTDFAKIQNSWNGYPYRVSMGAQKNFMYFANAIVEEWNKNNTEFNEIYFQNAVSIAIIFKHLEKLVSAQEWYEQGYRANIVTYTIALLAYLISIEYPGYTLNLMKIWNEQKVPQSLDRQLAKLAKHVFDFITDPGRPIVNVTEWCKKELCWKRIIETDIKLLSDIEDMLVNKSTIRTIVKDAKNDQKLINGIEALNEVLSLGEKYWEEMLEWGKAKKLLSDKEIGILSIASRISGGKLPTDKQAVVIIHTKERLLSEGFSLN